MDINWQQVWPWLAAAGAWVWKHARAVVAEAVALAERQQVLADGRLTHEELEGIAVAVVQKRLPLVPVFAVRWAIRRVCKWRKKTRLAAVEFKQ